MRMRTLHTRRVSPSLWPCSFARHVSLKWRKFEKSRRLIKNNGLRDICQVVCARENVQRGRRGSDLRLKRDLTV